VRKPGGGLAPRVAKKKAEKEVDHEGPYDGGHPMRNVSLKAVPDEEVFEVSGHRIIAAPDRRKAGQREGGPESYVIAEAHEGSGCLRTAVDTSRNPSMTARGGEHGCNLSSHLDQGSEKPGKGPRGAGKPRSFGTEGGAADLSRMHECARIGCCRAGA
jgi:hypothetical protein